MKLCLDEFAWIAIEQESTRLGIPEEELVRFAVMYYLADVDSGRIAREIRSIPPQPSPGNEAQSPG